jgi:NitT/TauT family transport system substrate-binding protein
MAVMKHIVAACLALVLCLSAGRGSAETVKISFTHSLANAPFLIAKERGYFATEGLSPEFIYSDSAGPITMAVVSGGADFGATGLSGGFLNLADYGAMRIIAGYIYDFPGFHGAALIVSNRAWDAGFRTFKDIPHHSVAVTQVGTGIHYSVSLLAEKFGFDMKDVRILPLQSFANSAAAVTGGSADAGVVESSYFQAALAHGDLHLVGYVGDQVKSQNGAIFTTGKTADERHDLVERVLRAFRRGARDYYAAFIGPDGKRKDGPDAPAMIALLAKAAQRTPAQVADTLAYIDPEGRVDTPGILRQIAWYKSQGMVKPDVDGTAIIDKRYVIEFPPE